MFGQGWPKRVAVKNNRQLTLKPLISRLIPRWQNFNSATVTIDRSKTLTCKIMDIPVIKNLSEFQLLTLFILNLLVSFYIDQAEPLVISGGGLPADYHLLQLHFHWGSDSSEGSEHMIGHRQFPLE